jgi:hypothetical protein
MPMWVIITVAVLGGIGVIANVRPSRRIARTAWG